MRVETKMKATKWEKISPTAGGNARVSVRLVSVFLSPLHLKFFMAELNFRETH
jgi:hypothetical protein